LPTNSDPEQDRIAASRNIDANTAEPEEQVSLASANLPKAEYEKSNANE